MDKQTLAKEMADGVSYGKEYDSLALALKELYDKESELCERVKTSNKSLVRATVACYESMIKRNHMGEEKKKYASARESFIKNSDLLNQAKLRIKELEAQLEAIKNGGAQ